MSIICFVLLLLERENKSCISFLYFQSFFIQMANLCIELVFPINNQYKLILAV